MADAHPLNPNPNHSPPLPTLSLPPPSPPPPLSPSPSPFPQAFPSDIAGGGRFVGLKRPPVRLTSEFDSEASVFFHKVSCKLFDGLAKLKLSFQNDVNGALAFPELGFLTRNFSVLYDVENRNALLKGSVDLANFLQVRASHNVKTGQIGEPHYFHIGCSRPCVSVSCTYENNKSIVSCLHLGPFFLFKSHYRKDQQGELSMIAKLGDPSYKLELSSFVPSVGLPRATFHFPLGEVSVEEQRSEEAEKVLSINGIVKSHFLNGVCTAVYRENDLNLRYCYKDDELSFIPSISLPSNAASFGFKRRFSPSDKMSYWYHFDSNNWNAVYKHTVGKDIKLKAGYDSAVQLGWASIWVGDQDGKAKTSPMKTKVQLMLQVARDDIRNPFFMFRMKKRWDF
ncbi:outer envelope pore protein 37, chloroplastic isoform X1 [Typha latifolia]|uniref:outer envelope pore protein 37, chloroplastic isoform X1 n=1 Tax=Typha latifolia TaxID=4733 RepID=UPI003C2D4464